MKFLIHPTDDFNRWTLTYPSGWKCDFECFPFAFHIFLWQMHLRGLL